MPKVENIGDKANSEYTEWLVLFHLQQSNHITHHGDTSHRTTS